MFEYIRELLGLADDSLDEVRDMHAFWVPKIVIGLDVLLLVAFLLNWGGLKWVNLVFSWILATVTIILATRPEGPAIAATTGVLSGAAQEPQTIPQELKKFLKLYVQWSATALFWASGILLALGTIPVEENPKAALVILATVIVIFSYVIAFVPTFVIARKTLYAFACFVFVANLLSLVPWTDYTGIDVFGTQDSGISAIEKKEQDRIKKDEKIFLAEIERRINRNKSLDAVLKELPPEDQALYSKLKKERNNRSLDNVVKAWWDNISLLNGAHAKNAPPPKPEPVEQHQPPVPVAVLPVAPPPPPPKKVVPQKAEKPEWELCVENKNIYAHRDWNCSGVTVEFKDNHREILIESVYGIKIVYRGFSSGEKGVMNGYWNVRTRGWDPKHSKFQLKFANRRWEYASGWREHSNDKRFKLVLKRTYMPPDSPEEEEQDQE